MLLKLQRYELDVGYTPGKLMFVADTLSRAYLPGTAPGPSDFDDDIEVMVHSLVTDLPVTSKCLDHIKEAAADDPVMQELKQMVTQGWPHHKANTSTAIRQYWHLRGDLHIAEGLMFYGEKVVIPEALKPEMLELIHESHQGVEKSKARVRAIMHEQGY